MELRSNGAGVEDTAAFGGWDGDLQTAKGSKALGCHQSEVLKVGGVLIRCRPKETRNYPFGPPPEGGSRAWGLA